MARQNSPHWTRPPTRNRPGVLPRSGDVVRVDGEASVQFGQAPFTFRVIRVHDWSTYQGWAWLDGYQLDKHGDAAERRSIWVQVGGLQPAGDRVEHRRPRPHRG